MHFVILIFYIAFQLFFFFFSRLGTVLLCSLICIICFFFNSISIWDFYIIYITVWNNLSFSVYKQCCFIEFPKYHVYCTAISYRLSSQYWEIMSWRRWQNAGVTIENNLGFSVFWKELGFEESANLCLEGNNNNLLPPELQSQETGPFTNRTKGEASTALIKVWRFVETFGFLYLLLFQ